MSSPNHYHWSRILRRGDGKYRREGKCYFCFNSLCCEGLTPVAKFTRLASLAAIEFVWCVLFARKVAADITIALVCTKLRKQYRQVFRTMTNKIKLLKYEIWIVNFQFRIYNKGFWNILQFWLWVWQQLDWPMNINFIANIFCFWVRTDGFGLLLVVF